MPPKNYKGVTLPAEMVEKIKEVIENYPEMGYSSVSEFIKDAIREKIVIILCTREGVKEQEPNMLEILEHVEKLRNLISSRIRE
ncbi:MAG: hypothetical protein H0Z28_04395 [Archaeoglobus sp.]|nr:hypothetical protein [Archaeoglobus sp.]